MPASDILNIAKLGLFAQQNALRVTTHNISNVNTPGFSRQSAVFEANPNRSAVSAASGDGVMVNQVSRQVDQMVEDRLTQGTQEIGRLQAKDRFLPLLENAFNGMQGGGDLSKSLESFFSATDTVADNPNSPVSRGEVVAQGNALAGTVQAINNSLNEIGLPVDKAITQTLNEINTKLSDLREININIVKQESSQSPALDLKDKRQTLLDDLATKIDIKVINQPDAGVQILTSKGQLLLDHTYVASFKRGSSIPTPTGFEGISMNGAAEDMTSSIQGGELKGLIELRDDVIHGTPNTNGKDGLLYRVGKVVDAVRWQINVATSQSVGKNMNTQQTGVFDLGQDLTSVMSSLQTDAGATNFNSRTLLSSQNVHAGQLNIAYGSDSNSMDKNVSVAVDPNMTIQQMADTLNSAFTSSDPPAPVSAVFVNNRLQVKALPGSVFGVTSDTSGVMKAFSTYVGSPVDVQNITAGQVKLAYGPDKDHLSSVDLSIDPATMSIQNVVDQMNQTFADNNPAVPMTAQIVNNRLQLSSQNGNVYGVVSDSSGMMAALGVGAFFSGHGLSDMDVNPELQNDNNTVPTGKIDLTSSGGVVFNNLDNKGALAMGALRATPMDMLGATGTLAAHYASVVGDVGSLVQSNKSNLTAANAAQDAMSTLRESSSGVSLDEELTNVIKFQRAFQASGKLVTVADEMMQDILKMVQ